MNMNLNVTLYLSFTIPVAKTIFVMIYFLMSYSAIILYGRDVHEENNLSSPSRIIHGYFKI